MAKLYGDFVWWVELMHSGRRRSQGTGRQVDTLRTTPIHQWDFLGSYISHNSFANAFAPQLNDLSQKGCQQKDGHTKRRRSCGTSSAFWGSRFLEARCSSNTDYYLVTLEKFLTWLSLHGLGYKIWKTTSARPVYLDRLWGSRKNESYLKTIKNFKNVRHDECGGDDVDESLYAGWVSRGMCTQICPEPINENRLREPDTWWHWRWGKGLQPQVQHLVGTQGKGTRIIQVSTQPPCHLFRKWQQSMT